MSLTQLRTILIGATVFFGFLLVTFGGAIVAMRVVLWQFYDVPLLP
jgi:hypothetical protein